MEILHEAGLDGISRGARIDGGGDRHRKGPHARAPFAEFEEPRPARLGAEADEIAAEIVGVLFGLQADEIVVAEGAHRLVVVGERFEDVGRRTGNMEEEADRIVVAARSKLPGEWQEVIIMDPDNVVGRYEGRKGVGESTVDAQIAAEIDRSIFD